MASPKGKVLIDADDIIGKCLGKLEVISYVGHRYDNTKGGERMRHVYRVQCDCGVVKEMRRSTLIGEKIGSCGCRSGRKKRVDR